MGLSMTPIHTMGVDRRLQSYNRLSRVDSSSHFLRYAEKGIGPVMRNPEAQD